jgi:hypothetical protein
MAWSFRGASNFAMNRHEPGRLREADQARILQWKLLSPRLATPVWRKG